ncbi:unnamed protein product [Symbiodinium natans]|uniref:Uncharacterized protein n=1 Tax=Symbiodinium natans TaxID=878477 RepID=A0A812SGP6_9DINO|nr:unnamed protein product [Symbiodinium natans]
MVKIALGGDGRAAYVEQAGLRPLGGHLEEMPDLAQMPQLPEGTGSAPTKEPRQVVQDRNQVLEPEPDPGDDDLHAARGQDPAAAEEPPGSSECVPNSRAQWSIQRAPGAKEPRFYYLKPQRLLCMRLKRGEELGQYASNVLDAVLEIVNMSKQNVDRVDTFEGKGCTILPLLHAQGVWRSEFISALATLHCPRGPPLQAVGFASNLKDRTRAMNLSLATALAMDLLSGRLVGTKIRELMKHTPVLARLVAEALEVKDRAEGKMPPLPTPEENYDFAANLMRRAGYVLHGDPKFWFAIGRVGEGDPV